jgi:hypothetical protein
MWMSGVSRLWYVNDVRIVRKFFLMGRRMKWKWSCGDESFFHILSNFSFVSVM